MVAVRRSRLGDCSSSATATATAGQHLFATVAVDQKDYPQKDKKKGRALSHRARSHPARTLAGWCADNVLRMEGKRINYRRGSRSGSGWLGPAPPKICIEIFWDARYFGASSRDALNRSSGYTCKPRGLHVLKHVWLKLGRDLARQLPGHSRANGLKLCCEKALGISDVCKSGRCRASATCTR